MNAAVGPVWLDPRPGPSSTRPATRPAPGTPRRLVFFDNGKLGPPYDRWMPIVPPLLAMLRGMGTVRQKAADLLTEPVARHAVRVAAWKKDGIDGVVFGLCDAGVTQPTLALAAAAEAAGIPTAVLCTGQVVDLAAASASFLAPGLPLVELPISRLDSDAQLAAAAQAATGAMFEALTADGAALQARAATCFPFAASLARPAHGGADGTAGVSPQDFPDYARRNHMADGFPVHTPTPARVQALLEAAALPTAHVLNSAMSPSGAPLTVQGAAICAAMAGCTPHCFPLVLAALRAMSEPRYQLPLAATTSHPSANILLFSGPLAHAAGVAHARGCLGPGHDANATIGRAVALTLQNVGRAIPGLSTLSMLGSPAQLACCFADYEDAALPPLHAVLGGASDTVAWVQKAESPHNVMDHISSTPESLLETVASVAATLGGNSAYLPSDLLVILNPEHAQIATRGGWRREDIQQFLWERARNARARLQGRGIKPDWPAQWEQWDTVPVAPGPERICVVVAGAPGPQSQVAVPWGYAQASWSLV